MTPDPTDLAGYHLGLFIDWDVLDLFANSGGTDPLRRTVWCESSERPALRHRRPRGAPVSNLSLVDNAQYVYPQSHIADVHKVQFLTGALSQPVADEVTDWASVAAVGPLSLPADGYVIVTFALVYGADAADYLANVEAAMGVVRSGRLGRGAAGRWAAAGLPAGPERAEPVQPVHRDPLHRAGRRPGGPRRVRPHGPAHRAPCVAASLPAGEHAVRWDGGDENGAPLASGLYLYRVTAGGQTQMRKHHRSTMISTS